MTQTRLDRRILDGATNPINPTHFFRDEFPAMAARFGAMAAAAMKAFGTRPLTLVVDHEPWSLVSSDGTIRVVEGGATGGVVAVLTGPQFSDWARNRISLNGMMVARTLTASGDDLFHLSVWDSLWLTLLSGWPTIAPGLGFHDRAGRPLDLKRRFAPSDDPADMRHFLLEAGYLHLRGWLDLADIDAISADMDRVMPLYAEGDGKSWWATLEDGSRRCVRQQEFVEHSPATARILSGPVWKRLRDIISETERLEIPAPEGRAIEALIKPIGVVAGPSDLSFHRDCHLGRHIHDCSRPTIGIVITPAGRGNGGLQVYAGSHRVAMPVEIAKAQSTLPLVEFDADPGDLTVHLSCTLHASPPPRTSERRVMYTSMAFAGKTPAQDDLARVREQVSDKLRDEHNHA